MEKNSFNYKLAINGSSYVEGNTIEDIAGGTRVTWSSGAKPVAMADMQFMRFPTYLNGIYTLAKQ